MVVELTFTWIPSTHPSNPSIFPAPRPHGPGKSASRTNRRCPQLITDAARARAERDLVPLFFRFTRAALPKHTNYHYTRQSVLSTTVLDPSYSRLQRLDPSL